MSIFFKKRRNRRWIYSPIVLIILAIVLFFVLRAFWDVYKKESLSLNNLNQTQADLDRLTAREKNLAQSIDYLKTDKGVESAIRSKFRLAKDGESIAVLVDDGVKASTTLTTKPSLWSRILHMIGL